MESFIDKITYWGRDPQNNPMNGWNLCVSVEQDFANLHSVIYSLSSSCDNSEKDWIHMVLNSSLSYRNVCGLSEAIQLQSLQWGNNFVVLYTQMNFNCKTCIAFFVVIGEKKISFYKCLLWIQTQLLLFLVSFSLT